MKLGYVMGDANIIYQPGDPIRYSYPDYPASRFVFSQMYPDDIYAMLNPKKIDFDICEKLDAVIYIMGVPDEEFASVAKYLPCKTIALEAFGYEHFITYYFLSALKRKRVMDACDYVMVTAPRAVSMVREWTDTPIIEGRFPTAIGQLPEILAEVDLNSVPQYDILVLYGPTQSDIYRRNGYTSILLAEKMVAEIPEFQTIGLCSHTKNLSSISWYQDALKTFGCPNCQLIKRLPYREFLPIISKAKIIIDLDMCLGAGKLVVECAALRKPIIASDYITAAFDIYKDLRVHFPIDIDAMMQTARMVANNKWPQSWFDIAYERAQQYSIENVAKKLESDVK